jgi:hypothetical protein
MRRLVVEELCSHGMSEGHVHGSRQFGDLPGWCRGGSRRVVSESSVRKVGVCENHNQFAWENYQGDENPVYTGWRCSSGSWVEGANAWDCRIVSAVVITDPEVLA